MSTIQKTTQPVKPISTTPRASGSGKTAGTATQREMYFLFDKENYMLMLGGIGLILLGFALMAGGKSANPHEFHYDEIYSFRRITLAPIVLLLGFAVEVFAIMKKPKASEAVS